MVCYESNYCLCWIEWYDCWLNWVLICFWTVEIVEIGVELRNWGSDHLSQLVCTLTSKAIFEPSIESIMSIWSSKQVLVSQITKFSIIFILYGIERYWCSIECKLGCTSLEAFLVQTVEHPFLSLSDHFYEWFIVEWLQASVECESLVQVWKHFSSK